MKNDMNHGWTQMHTDGNPFRVGDVVIGEFGSNVYVGKIIAADSMFVAVDYRPSGPRLILNEKEFTERRVMKYTPPPKWWQRLWMALGRGRR